MNPMTPKRTRRLRARAATMNTHDEEFDDYGPEPNMKLSHAFMVVLLLHVIAVGGLYAFNSMKAGKQVAPKVAKSSGASAAGQALKENASPEGKAVKGEGGGGPEEPQNQPPSEQPKAAPVVAKIAESPKATTSLKSLPAETKAPKAAATSEVASASTKKPGLLASMKGSLQKAAGIGATTATAGAVTHKASAQISSNVEAITGASNGAAVPAAESSSPLAAGKTYMVKAGDTVTRIASSVGVAIPDLEKANGLISDSVLQVGQVLKVPEKAIAQAASSVSAQAEKVASTVATAATGVTGAAAPAIAPAPAATIAAAQSAQAGMTEYTVVKGDNPYKMAKRFKITPEELMKANGITDPKKIQIGQKLMIPAASKK